MAFLRCWALQRPARAARLLLGSIVPPGPVGDDGASGRASLSHMGDAVQGRQRSPAGRPSAGRAGRGAARGSYAFAGSATGACETLGSQWSDFGREQFQSPSSFITAGSSTPRTIVASISTATDRPTPNSLNSIDDSVA